jgi:hypothetical protein
MNVDDLYAAVTEAILRAEGLEASGATVDAEEAYFRVSALEEEIALMLGPEDEEGAIARRGAVTAAISARMPTRALDLADSYLSETTAPEPLLRQLRELADQARALLPPQSEPRVRPDARVRLPSAA